MSRIPYIGRLASLFSLTTSDLYTTCHEPYWIMYPITLYFNTYIEQFTIVLKETFTRNKIGIVVEGVLVSFLFRFLEIISLLAIV